MRSASDVRSNEMPKLLRGDVDAIRGWIGEGRLLRHVWCVAAILACAGIYGAAIGWWRSPEQALLTAIKFPLVLLLTTLGNALLNGMLAPLLGLDIAFRQSALAILMSQTIAAVVLAAFSPIVFFEVWNLPPMSDASARMAAAAFIRLTQVVIIAFAGVVSNIRLAELLKSLSGSAPVARAVLGAWLAGNLLLGTQLTWMLRPFFGSPTLPVQFFRSDAFHGNFFETVFRSAATLLNP